MIVDARCLDNGERRGRNGSNHSSNKGSNTKRLDPTTNKKFKEVTSDIKMK